MKNILWLPSWYPNKTAPFDGDFIQRMAKATAIYAHVHVLYIVRNNEIGTEKTEQNSSGNLEETIVYYHAKKTYSNKLFGRIRFLNLYRKYIMRFIKKNGKPDFVHVQVPARTGIIALWLKARYRIPYIVTEHYGIYNEVVEDRFSRRSVSFKTITRKVLARANAFLPVSRQLGEEVSTLVVKKNYTVVPNTVNTKFFFYKGDSLQKFRFIHVSNMIPLKNVQGIINACQVLDSLEKDFELVLVGTHPQEVFQHAVQSGLLEKNIFFKGEISYEAVATEMQVANCLVLFSQSENMPCVVLEALCCGVPVIATNVGGIPEVINDENGYLVDKGNEKQLADSMKKMLYNYPEFNREVIARKASELFSYETIGKQIYLSYR